MKNKKRILTWVVVLVLAMVLVAGGIFATNPEVSLDKGAAINEDGKTYDVTLSVTGSEVTSQNTADVILAIDLSNSMTNNKSKSLAITKAAANDFITTTLNTNADGNVRVAVVAYGEHSYAYDFKNSQWDKIGSIKGDADTYFTKDQTTAANVINSETFKPKGIAGDSGGTNTEGGFLVCRDVMNTSISENKITIFMTDGVPTYYYDGNNYTEDLSGSGSSVSNSTFNEAVDAALALKADGSTIYTIGLLTGYETNSANMNCANYLLSDADSYTRTERWNNIRYTARTDADAYPAQYVAVTNADTAAKDIAKVYENLAVKVNDLANGSVTDIIPANFTLTAGEQAELETAGATVIVNEDGTTKILWPVALNKEEKQLSYNITPKDNQYGTAFTNESAVLEYTVGDEKKTETFPQPDVLINTVNGNTTEEVTVYDPLEVATVDLIESLNPTYLEDKGASTLEAFDAVVADKAEDATATCEIKDGKLVFTADRVGTYTITYKLQAKTANDASPVTTATVTVTVKPIAITVTANSDEKIYDGEPLVNASATVEGLRNNDTLGSVTVTGEQIDAGTSTNVASAATIINGDDDVTANYEISYADGTLTVEKRDVTLTSASDEKSYDGTPLTNDTVTVGGDGFAEGEGATYDVTGAQTEVGSSANTFTYELNNAKAENYNITQTDGTLTVTAATEGITITAPSDSKPYDGTALTNDAFKVEGLPSGYTLSATVEGTQTEVGECQNVVSNAIIKNSSGEDVTKNFNAPKYVNGILTVTPAKVTMISADAEKVYDGENLTNNEVTFDGFAEGEGATYDVTGKQLNVGTSENAFTYLLNENTKAENYEITQTNGTLKVTPRPVTLTSGDAEKTYDGTPLINKNVIEEGFVKGEGATYNVTGAQTDVGSSANTFDYTFNEGTLADNYTVTKVEGTLRVKQGELTLNNEDHMRYMQGYPEGDFRPERQMTRAEVAVMFCRLLNNAMEIDSSTEAPFSDIYTNDWYYNEICFMAEHGILKGYDNGTFGPNKAITRAEFATICTRFDVARQSETKPIVTSFPDVTEGQWFYNGVMQAAANGWVGGRDDGNFCPNDYITRAEVVTVVNRVLERKADKAYVDNAVATKALEFKTYSDLVTDGQQHWAYYDIYEASTSHDYEKNAEGIETQWVRHWLELYTVAYHVTNSDADPAAVIVAKGTTVTLPKADEINGINSADFAGWSLTKDGAELLGETYVVDAADSFISANGIDHNIIHIYGILK